MAIQQFELLKKSAVTEIQADLEAAVLADRLLAESARDAAQLAQTAAETAETNAELAETNAELAETNAEAAKDLAVAAANAFPATNPQVAYHSRVLADSGVIKDLDRLTELYMNQLNLLPYTHFMWDGNSGYKVVDGKLVKVYSMDNAGSDGTTSAGTEPYAGGLIAPNESLKMKITQRTTQNKINLLSNISFASNVGWSISFAVKVQDNLTSLILGNTTLNRLIYLDYYSVIFYNGTTGYSFANAYSNSEICKTIIFSIVADGNGNLILYKNGVLFSSISAVTTADFNQILGYAFGNSAFQSNNELSSISILSKKLSAYEIQLQHELLRLQHPEIEGIDIGNQHWASSNYEGVVTGNGTVIPEYKYTAANSHELVVNGDFATDTDWDKGIGWSISGGTANCDGSQTGLSAIKQVASLTNGKYYKVTYTISNYSAGSVRYWQGGNTGGTPRTANGTYTENLINDGGYILFETDADFIGSIDNVSVKEAGWDELTTPAWCYYNNDPALGAVYGKLYNWYAVNEIAKNPPAGWRVPSEADFIQLRDYLGGAIVAGGKMKAKYSGFDNSFATNESGFSWVPAGVRNDDGVFYYIFTWATLYTSENYIAQLGHVETNLYVSANGGPTLGCSLRLLRNSPVGEDTKIVSTGRFATDISSNPKVIAIPFGYKVENIVINSSNALTGVTSSLYNYSDALQNELLASTTVDANVPNIFDINSHKMLLQDGYVKVLATGNTGDGMTIDVVLKKIQ